ncbi:MAG: hypothetical protein ACJAYY_002573, partial [Paraglaciecola sp.]
ETTADINLKITSNKSKLLILSVLQNHLEITFYKLFLFFIFYNFNLSNFCTFHPSKIPKLKL